MSPAPYAVRVRTPDGWQDIALVGPQGPKGDPGVAGAAGAPGTVYDSDSIGTVKSYAGTTMPTNWMLCDGRPLLRATYPELFTVVGTTYGAGDGSTTFNLPDLRSRMIIGAGPGSGAAPALGAGLTARTANGKGGEEKHTLLTAEAAQKATSTVASATGGGTTGNDSPDHTHLVGNIYNGAGSTFV